MTNSGAGSRTALLAWLEMSAWRQPWCEASWQEFLGAGETESELRAIRRCTHTGRPLGTGEFVEKLERHTQRCLAPQKGGREPNLKTRQEEGTPQNQRHRYSGSSEILKRFVCPRFPPYYQMVCIPDERIRASRLRTGTS